MLDISAIQEKYGTEMALVILCCRVFFGSAKVAELAHFIKVSEINWQDFLRLARMHRVRPVVFKTIVDLGIPEDVKSLIRTKQLELVKASLKIAVETERVILLLKQNNIETIPYKGISYSKQFFGDLVSREISDIDLVIRPADLAKAVDILSIDGYEAELEDIYQYLGTKIFNYFKDYNLNKLKNGERDFHLELHWGVTEKEIGISLKAGALVYDTGTQEVLAKTSILTLSPPSHFSAMLVHNTFKDNLIFLKNIVDVSQGIKSAEVQNNCDLIVQRFKEFGIRKSLSVNNNLSELLMGVSLSQIKDFSDSEQTARYFLDQLCSRRAFSNDDSENMVARVKHTAMLQNSFIKRAGYYWLCLQFRFIPGRFDFRYVRLPGPLFFVYYFIKPFRTITRSFSTNKT